ncbi:hypothetical protein ABW22_11085 [Thiobacillus denitrificans]|uniref:Uncharacterized protein n=2 Tax=Thiobacillus denitrificans TaxID=36861 RepID=A0A106BM29_THIDE|nr:hypothetical protein ABW22_11085 [Thiobacillus denitrificans]
MCVWSLAILAGSVPGESVAGMQVESTDTRVNRQPAVRAVSYGAPVYEAYARPGVNDASNPDELSVSAVPEVDRWAMLAAILGLIGMRLWHGGKKNLPVIK